MKNSVTTTSGKIKVKVVLLGNQMVGKSSIIEKYVKGYFDQSIHPTVGIDFLVKNVPHRGKNYRLQLWDTAGQQRFRSLIPNYLKDAKCALIVIDVSREQSLDCVDSWYQLYNDNKTVQGFAFLVGNKIDLEDRQITNEKGKKKAEQLGIPYYELSAKTGQNIDAVFFKILDTFQQIAGGTTYSQSTDKKQQQPQQQNPIQQHTLQQDQQSKQKTKQHRKSLPITAATNVVLKNEKIVNFQKNNDQKNSRNSGKKSGCC